MIAALFAFSVMVDAGPYGCRAPGRTGAATIEVVDEDADARGTLSFVDVMGGSTLEFPMDLRKGTHKRWIVPLPPATHLSVRWRAAAGPAPAIQEQPRSDCTAPLVVALARDGAPAAARWVSSHGSTRFELGELAPADLDGPWVALEGADLVVTDARALSELSDARFETLTRWVEAGGLLYVVPGADPAPLAASGRLGGLDVTGAEPREAARGQGAIVARPLTPDAAPAPLADWAVARASQSHRDREIRSAARESIGAALEAAAGPAGIPPIPPLVLAGLIAVFAGAHDLLRRRWVGGNARDLRRYLPFTAGGIASLSLIALVAGALGGAGARPLVVIPSGGSAGVSIRRFEAAAGRRVTLAPGLWPRLSAPGTIVAVDGGAQFAVVGSATAPADGIAIGAATIDGTVTVDAGARVIANGLSRPLPAGWEIEASAVVPPIPAGGTASIGVERTSPTQWSALGRTVFELGSRGRSGYLVPSGGDWLLVEPSP